MIGQTIGSYKVTAKLGEGGMGAVFRGEHTVLGRGAAIKVLLPDFSNNKEVVQRFFNEAKATTAIKHPGIVEIYDFGHHTDGSAYIVMELLQGEPLSHLLHREKKLDPELAVSIIIQVASALGAAHQTGIIHRDLKPDNIFLVPDPLVAHGMRAKLLDFGIAKLNEDLRGDLDPTRAGAVLGTPPYMAPEQCVGSTEVNHRADLYALGCLLFHCLCGRPPFTSQDFGRIMIEHMQAPPPKPRDLEPSIPQNVEQVTLKLLEKEPKDRYQSCNDLVIALRGRAATPIPVVDSPSAPVSAPADPTLKDPPEHAATLTPPPSPGATPTPTPTPAPEAKKPDSRKRTALYGEPLPEMLAKNPKKQTPTPAPGRKKTARMGQPLPGVGEQATGGEPEAVEPADSRKRTALMGEHHVAELEAAMAKAHEDSAPQPQPTPAPQPQPTPAPKPPGDKSGPNFVIIGLVAAAVIGAVVVAVLLAS